MLGGGISAVYLIGFFATPYVMGLFGGDRDLILIPMVLWPVYLVFCLPMRIAKVLYELGQRHR